uniref:Peptidase S1 domain-containing protein n=1 Tax=Chelonoidis abingdonii TaxID=106734 RepID=A0A8C0JEI1_CHEAB
GRGWGQWAVASLPSPPHTDLCPSLPAASPRENRIIGGTECPESEHPWLVLLYYFDQHYCSGTLLNPTWVLTAAHCQQRWGCVNINIVSNTICQDAYPEKVTENMLCAGVLEGGKDSCQVRGASPRRATFKRLLKVGAWPL